MGKVSDALLRTALDMVCVTGAHRLLRRFAGGDGAILVLHHVRPARTTPFRPNRSLEITPEFLRAVVRRLQKAGIEFVSLDEACSRLAAGDVRRRFACMTLDDGYRDNLVWAYPIFKELGVPFALFVTTDLVDRRGTLWWEVLETVIARHDTVEFVFQGRRHVVETGTLEQKQAGFRHVADMLWAAASEPDLDAAIRDLAGRYGIDLPTLCDDLCLDWNEVAELAADPLVTIGVHTVSHPRLATLSADEARAEVLVAQRRLAQVLGTPPRHLAYPYGDSTSVGPREHAIAAELGFRTALTTRRDVLRRHDWRQPTALPRIEIKGTLGHPRHVDLLVSGAVGAVRDLGVAATGWRNRLSWFARRAADDAKPATASVQET